MCIYIYIYIKDEFNASDAFSVPKPILCGGYDKLIREAIVWMSSGGTTSGLHTDEVDNINCLFDGTKQMVMIDKVNDDILLQYL